MCDGALWELPVTLVPRPEALERFLADAEAQLAAGRELPFATVDRGTGKVVGSTRFRNIDVANRRVEIGFTFLAQQWQRTYANTEAKYLMLQHAFESWGSNRVEFVTDVLNGPSRAAIVRIGAREEGILRHHMVMPNGRLRDSVVYSMLAGEWPVAKARLEARLQA